MRVDIYTNHLSPYVKVAESQMKHAARKYCKERWGKPLEECNYLPPSWTTHSRYDQRSISCAVLVPGYEQVTLVLNSTEKI